MKKIFSLLIVVVMLISSTAVTFSVAEKAFSDVPANSWYHDAVIKATDLEFFTGTGGGYFSPNNKLTRAMLVTVLAKAAKVDSSQYKTQIFKDVTTDKWYFTSCNWASKTGLVSGTGDGYFSPDTNLTREQLCIIMAHFCEKYGKGLSAKFDYREFSDDTLIAAWAHDYVHTMRQTGCIEARVDNYFVPKSTVSRAELAIMVLAGMGELDTLPTDPQRHIYSVSVSPATVSVQEQQSTQLTAKILPENATDKSVTWSSSDTSVATVDNGKISALKPGSTVITVVANDGTLSASAKVTVTKKPEPIPEPEPKPTPPSKRYIDPNKPMLALTFDDGPHKTYSTQILDVLEKYGVVATFFEQGMNVARYPAVIKREVALGCEIGSHTYDHPKLTTLSYSQIRNQIDSTNNAFLNACGQVPKIMRPPYGSRNATVDSAVNMPLILWSVDTLDWKYKDSDYVYNYVMNNAYDGAIILMHSIHGTTAAAMSRIVPGLIKKGYQLVTVSELAYYKGYTMKNGSRYSSFK